MSHKVDVIIKDVKSLMPYELEDLKNELTTGLNFPLAAIDDLEEALDRISKLEKIIEDNEEALDKQKDKIDKLKNENFELDQELLKAKGVIS